MPIRDLWILDGERRPRRVETVEEWSRFYETDARVVRQELIGDVRISTVFLGIDSQLGNGPPVLFETMVFGGKNDMHFDRCSTWDHAVAMHEKICALVRSTDGHADGRR